MDHQDTSATSYDEFFDFEQASIIQGNDDELAVQLSDFLVTPTDAFSNLPTIDHSQQALQLDSILDLELQLHDTVAPALDEDDNDDPLSSFADFSNWIPRYSKPMISCGCCMMRGFECYFTYEHQKGCSPCESLFKTCSFVDGHGDLLGSRDSQGKVTTLHVVSEDVAQLQGGPTGNRPLFTKGASMYDIMEDMNIRCPEKNLTSRFSRATITILKHWLNTHADNPNPTDQDKDQLKEQTGLTRTQISNWFANARRRGKAKQKRPSSPIMATSLPINVPGAAPNGSRQANLTPLDRWKESPPENEPASMTAIARAVATSEGAPDISGSSSRSHSNTGWHRSSSAGSGFSAFQAPSVSSFETGQSSGSHGSYGSAWSHSSSRGSYSSFARKTNRRRRRTLTKLPMQSVATSATNKRPFQCTFCTDTFQHKYDWARHEKSLHLSPEKWMCAPLGPFISSDAEGGTYCVYCELPNPTLEHLEVHHWSDCGEKELIERTFARKDHLRQHLRLVHGVTMLSSMELWKSTAAFIQSRCGFCPGEPATTFTTWQDRVDHLARHFREGAEMSQWVGDWGFEPAVNALVRNAVPPFLISTEARSPDPYSASGQSRNEAMHPQYVVDPIDPPAHRQNLCWQVLTLMLGQFVRSQQELGQQVTDAMLQRHARIILFGEDDSWNQTAADNKEWLTLFKQAHGLLGGGVTPTGGFTTAGNMVRGYDVKEIDALLSAAGLNVSHSQT